MRNLILFALSLLLADTMLHASTYVVEHVNGAATSTVAVATVTSFSVVAQTDQACATTCGSANCVAGMLTLGILSNPLVDCADATADKCICVN